MEVLTSQVAHLERVRQVYDAKFVHLLFFRAASTALCPSDHRVVSGFTALQPPHCILVSPSPDRGTVSLYHCTHLVLHM